MLLLYTVQQFYFYIHIYVYIDLNDLHHQFIVCNGEGSNSNPLDRVVRKNSAGKWIINDSNNNTNRSNNDKDKKVMMKAMPCKSAKYFQIIWRSSCN